MVKNIHKRGNKGKLIVGVILFIILGLFLLNKISKQPNMTTRELAMSCTLDMYTQFHIHPHLEIVINGEHRTVPANTGISFSCMHPLHTHDDTGTIHVESPTQQDFTVGDFFAVWGQLFSKDQILDAKTDTAHEIVMTVNGIPSSEYENLVLRDKDQIVIEYKQK